MVRLANVDQRKISPRKPAKTWIRKPSATIVPVELGTRSQEKAEQQHHSAAKLAKELASKDAYIAELEAAREQQLSARPSSVQEVETATVKQLIDALVARAKEKSDFEIMQIVDQVCSRLAN